jgi:hypothetical protein
MSADQQLAAAVLVAFVAYLVVDWYLTRRRRKHDDTVAYEVVGIDVTPTIAAMTAALLEQALADGTLKPGDHAYLETQRHPSGVDVPIRIWSDTQIEDVFGAEAEEYLQRRRHA